MTTDADGQEEMFEGANVSKLEDGDILASLSAWARCFGTSRETLQDRLVEAGVQSKGKKQGYPMYGGRDVYNAWLSGPEARIDPDSLKPFQRRAWYQGEHEKLRLQQERAELVSALEVEQTMGRLAKVFAQGLDTIVDVMERDVGLTALQAKRMEQHVDRLREGIYQELAGKADEDPPAQDDEEQPSTPKKPAPASSALEAAIAFLRAAVAGGPRRVSELVAAAKEAGISEGTLRRAKARLGKAVVAKRDGRAWAWSLAAKVSKPAKRKKKRKAKPRKSRKRRKRPSR